MKLVIDIETVAIEENEFSESQREFILREALKIEDENLRSKKEDESIRLMSLFPFTGKIISIGLMSVDRQSIYVMYEDNEQNEWFSKEMNCKFKSMSESQMLSCFWKYVNKCNHLISFNGRNFDLPFLMLRSSILEIKPSRNFLKSRYDSKYHTDLLECFSMFGLTKKFNLDFYCRAYDIKTPKSDSINGMEIRELYKAGRRKEIAFYCAKDVYASCRLYEKWDKYLNIQ